jgi:hypothetical protein
LVLLEDDMSTNRMRDIAKMDGRVHLYLMHPLGEPDIIEVIENRPNEGVNENGPNEGVNEGGPIEGVKENGPNEGVHVVEATEGLNEAGSSRGVTQKSLIAEGIEAESCFTTYSCFTSTICITTSCFKKKEERTVQACINSATNH